MNEAAFDLPAGFSDRTVTCLTGKSPQGEGVLLLVERRILPEGMSLREAISAMTKTAMTRFINYQVLYEREVEVASRPALDVGARWRTETAEPVYDRRVHFTSGDAWLIVIGEAPMGERDFCDAYVDRVIGTLKLRE